jgi:hypothetical protein
VKTPINDVILAYVIGVLVLNFYWLKRILKAAKAVIKRFSKSTGSHMNGLLTAAAHSLRNAAKNCVL